MILKHSLYTNILNNQVGADLLQLNTLYEF